MIEIAPKPGDIGLTSVVGPVGRLISLGEFLCGDGFSLYEHAFLVLDGGELIEAQPGGAVIRPLSEYDGREVLYVAPASYTDGQRAAVCAAGSSLVGTPYSFADFAAIAAHRFRLPIPGLRRYIADGGHLICSALVDKAFQEAGIQLFNDGRWNGWVTPADLYRLLSKGGDRQ